MLTFGQFLKLYNEYTVSQIIKKRGDLGPIVRQYAALLRGDIPESEALNQIAKYFAFRYSQEQEKEENFADIKHSQYFLSHKFQPVKDYIMSQIHQGKLSGEIKSKLNNPQYTTDQLIQDNRDWHERLAAKSGGKGAPGKTIIKLDRLGPKWQGWKWVNLGEGYCRIEGNAMGHCGNVGAKEGDEILSLRDENDFVFLTFILNDGMLGEMKGRANTKPAEKYHPAIVELLKSRYVETILGGGYLPEENFSFEDLDKETQEEIEKLKPDINRGFDILADKAYEEAKEYEKQYDFEFANAWLSDDVENINGRPYLNYSGGFHLEIPVNLIKPIPGWSKRQELRKLKAKISDLAQELAFSLEDFEINQEATNNLTVRGYFYDDDYYESKGTPEGYNEFLDSLERDVEPKKDEFKRGVLEILTEEGYAAPAYTSKVYGHGETHESWKDNEFKNFKWDSGEERGHSIDVWMDKIILGKLNNIPEEIKKDSWSGTIKPDAKGFNSFYMILTDKLNKIAQTTSRQQKYFPGFEFMKETRPKFTHPIKPDINYWFDRDNNIYFNLTFHFNLTHSEEDMRNMKSFLDFLDNNFDRFIQEARQIFENNIKPIYGMQAA